MNAGYYIVHLEDEFVKDNIFQKHNGIQAQLRYFAYPGAFTSSVIDKFKLDEYDFSPIKLTMKKSYTFKGGIRTEIYTKRTYDLFRGEYSNIINQCKKIFMTRNPNICFNNIQ